jgi:hypothetical protein
MKKTLFILLIVFTVVLTSTMVSANPEPFDFEKNCIREMCGTGVKGTICSTSRMDDDNCILRYSKLNKDDVYCNLIERNGIKDRCYQAVPVKLNTYWIFHFSKSILWLMLLIVLPSLFLTKVTKKVDGKRLQIMFYFVAVLSTIASFMKFLNKQNIGWFLRGGVNHHSYITIFFIIMTALPLLSLVLSFFIKKRWFYISATVLNAWLILLSIFTLIAPYT